MRAFARWRRLRDKEWAMGWVMTTALNLTRRIGSRSSERSIVSVNVPQIEDASATRLDLVEVLSHLPARQKQATVLHYIGGYPVEKVADLMNVSPGAVKSHLFKARASLRTAMSDYLRERKEQQRWMTIWGSHLETPSTRGHRIPRRARMSPMCSNMARDGAPRVWRCSERLRSF